MWKIANFKGIDWCIVKISVICVRKMKKFISKDKILCLKSFISEKRGNFFPHSWNVKLFIDKRRNKKKNFLTHTIPIILLVFVRQASRCIGYFICIKKFFNINLCYSRSKNLSFDENVTVTMKFAGICQKKFIAKIF